MEVLWARRAPELHHLCPALRSTAMQARPFHLLQGLLFS